MEHVPPDHTPQPAPQGPAAQPQQPQVQYIPVAMHQQPVRRRWTRWLKYGAITFVAVLVLFNLFYAGLQGEQKVHEQYHSLARLGTDKVAIIRVEGTILDGEGFVKDQIDQVRDDEQVKAVVLRVDSPGGTVTGSDYIYHHLRELARERKIPVVVSMGSLAASGGYYVAMAVGDTPDSIYAEPTTWTGSIGVIIPHYNVAGLMQEWKIESDSIASGPLKGMGSITKKMTEEERAVFKALVDESFERFKEIIRSGRPEFRDEEGREKLDRIATGQIYTAKQAKANGLVDEIGFLEEAIDRAIVLAKLDPDLTRVVEYEQPVGLVDVMLGAQAQARAPLLDLSAIMNLATPKAYYLMTMLPAAVQSAR